MIAARTALAAMAGLVVVGLGYAAGRWSAPATAAAAAAEGPRGDHRTPASTAPLLAPQPGAQDPEMLRRIVREEVRSALREDLARPGGPERAVDAAPPADPLAEAATALARPEARPHAEEALATLDAAVARHRWGEADRQRFTAAVSLLEPRARVEIERRLMVAMNRDELVLDPGTSPFEAPGTGR